MPFETKRIVQDADAYLIEVRYVVERRKIIPVKEGSERKALAEAEKQMREDIIREIVRDVGGVLRASNSEERKQKLR